MMSHDFPKSPIQEFMSRVQGRFKDGDKPSCPIRLRSGQDLARALIGPAAAAKLFSNRRSNLSASKEGGQGGCDRVNHRKCLALQGTFVKVSAPFASPSLVPARPG